MLRRADDAPKGEAGALVRLNLMSSEVPHVRIPSQRVAIAEPVLEVGHLTIRFDETVVLGDLSFTVARGDILAVIGPNGSGKTGLFRALIGVLLMGSLIIIPAVVAKRVAQSIDGMFITAIGATLLSTLLGNWVAALTQRPSGPAIAGRLFFLSPLKF